MDNKMQGFVSKQMYVVISVYLGQVVVGFGNSWPVSMIPKLIDPEETPLTEVMSSTQLTIMTGIFFAGLATGPYLFGFLSNRIGREPCLIIGGTFCLLSFCLLTFVNGSNVILIYVGRICMGFGTAIITVGSVVYIGEIATVKTRGFLLTASGIFHNIGSILMTVLGHSVPYFVSNVLGAFLVVYYLSALCANVPESPVYFMMNGSEEKLKKSLHRLGRDDEFDAMVAKKNDLPRKRKRDDWLDIIRVKSNRKAFIITLTLSLLQQFAGMAAVVFFADTTFRLLETSLPPAVAVLASNAPQFIASCATPFFIEVIGRRGLLMISTSSCALSLAIMGTYFFIDLWSTPVFSAVWIPVIILIHFFLSTELGFNKIPQVFLGEMFTPHVRSTGTAIVISISSLFGYMLTLTFGFLLQFGAHIPFWIYALSSAGAFVFILLVVPETKGKTFEEIQEMLDKGGLIRQR